jgi:hypothetical protein
MLKELPETVVLGTNPRVRVDAGPGNTLRFARLWKTEPLTSAPIETAPAFWPVNCPV